MVFKKKKMINRLTKKGLSNRITPAIMKIMDNIDGCEAVESDWSVIKSKGNLLWVKGRNGIGEYVNRADCE